MKNIICTVLLLAGAFALQAQTEKGTFSLGLNNFSSIGLLGEGAGLLAPTNGLGIGFGSVKSKVDGQTRDEKPKYTSVGLSFDGHYFLIDNLSIGAGANVFTQTVKEGDNKATFTLLMAGPRVRYFIPTGEKSKVFIRGGASFGSAKSKFEGEEEDEPTKLMEFGGGAGLAFFPNPNVSINIGVGYSAFMTKDEYTFLGTTTEQIDTYSGLVLDVGFGLFF